MQKQEIAIESKTSPLEMLGHAGVIFALFEFPLVMFYVLALITLTDSLVDSIKDNVQPEKLPKIPQSVQKIYGFANNYTLHNLGSKAINLYNFFSDHSTADKRNEADRNSKAMNKKLYEPGHSFPRK